MSQKKDKLIVISGPSGVGKSTICKELAKRYDAFLSTSVTTRPIGEGEVDGQNYKYISKEEFEKGIRQEAFLEYANVFGNYYGTPWQPVDEALEEGKKVILEIDVQGGLKVKKVYPDAKLVFILPPDLDALTARMDKRGRGESEEVRQKRIKGASEETAMAWQYYDNMIINDDLESAINEIGQIISN